MASRCGYHTEQHHTGDVVGRARNAREGRRGPRYNETDAGMGGNDTGRTIISEAWYYNHVFGRPQEGISVPVNATGSTSNCAKAEGALWYYEPTESSVRG